MEMPRSQKPSIGGAVARNERSSMSCVAVHVRADGAPDGAAERPERSAWHAAFGSITGIAPEDAGGDKVSASLWPGIVAGSGRFRSASRPRVAARKSDPRRHGARCASRSGLGIVPATVWTALPTGARSPSGLQQTGGRLSAGVVDRF